MNIIQFFHRKEEMPPFKTGDKVRLINDPLRLLPLYNKYNTIYPSTEEQWLDGWKNLQDNYGLGNKVLTVTKVIVGTSAAGGWFVYIGEYGFHGNIFELVPVSQRSMCDLCLL